MRCEKRYDAFHESFKRIGLQLLIVLVSIPLLTLVISVIVSRIFELSKVKDLHEPTFIQGIFVTYFLTFSITFLYDAIYFFHKFKEAILEKEQIQKAHIQAQLDNLRNQINPHFLFNSLNTLMNLIPTNPDRAMNYLSKLSKFYRYAVSNQEASLVPIQTELQNVKIYTDLLKERFHESIRINLSITESIQGRLVPLCLQLLIENAVKHNIVSKKKPLEISIQLIENEKYIEVRNNIQKKIQEVSSTGIGLKNIRNRVAFFTDAPLLVHEDNHHFSVAVPII